VPFWKKKTYLKSITTREGNPPFVVFEGPPVLHSCYGAIRYFADIKHKGIPVKRKASWDTTFTCGIRDRGCIRDHKRHWEKISIEAYNEACKKNRDALQDVNDLTEKGRCG
jgi:isoleucyl-tRNA synthetase